MLTSFLKSLGIGDDVLRHVDRAEFAFQRPSLFWMGVLLLIPIAWLIYRRQKANLPTAPARLRVALSATRVLVLLMLIFVLAGPHLRIDHRSERKPVVAFLLDRSGSMQLSAGPFRSDEELAKVAVATGQPMKDGKVSASVRKSVNQMKRADVAVATLDANREALLDSLSKKFDVRLFSVSRRAAPVPLDLEKAKEDEGKLAKLAGADLAPEDIAASHLGDAVLSVLDEAAGRNIAGIVLLSDGRNTGGASPAEAAQAANRAGAPVFAVPIGPAERLRDISIVGVNTSGLVSVNDTVRVSVTLESQGFDGKPIKVELREGDKTLDFEEIALKGSEQQLIELSFEAKESGPRYLTIHAPPPAEEPKELHENNTDLAFVRVSDEKLKVLVIDGYPRWDFRFLKNSIRRDHGLTGASEDSPDVLLGTEWSRLSDSEKAGKLPAKLDDLAKYHVVILGDASPEMITSDFRNLLAQAVQTKGLGLIVAAGPRHMPHAYDDEFRQLLPVLFRPKSAGTEAPAHRPFRLEVSPAGAVHEAMRLYDDPTRNENIWSQMPAFHWAAAAERPSPAATVLAYNPSVESRFGKMPLVAWQYAGEGKVAFVGTDSTWMWRQNIGDLFFYKFWGQMVRFVARRDESAGQKSRVEVRPVRARPGEQAQIELFAFGAEGEPVKGDRAEVSISVEGQAQAVQLAADKASPGRFTGKFTPQRAGEHRIAWQGAGQSPVEAKIRVIAASEELRDPNLNRPLLELMASTTGGEVVEVSDLKSLPEKLKGEPTLTELHREAPVWDNWLMLLLLSVVYSADVAIRRLIGLS